MTTSVHSAGVWKPFVHLYVKSAGVWKTVQVGYVKNGGVWKQFWADVTRTFLTGAQGTMSNLSASAGIRSASLILNTDGTVNATSLANAAWTTPTGAGIGNSYYCKCTGSGGNVNYSGDTRGSWLPLSSARSFIASNSSGSLESTGTFTVQISPDNGATVSSTFTYDWDVGKTP